MSPDDRFREVAEQVVADNAEVLRRLALGPGVEDIVLREREIVAEAVEEARAARRRELALGVLEEYVHNLREAADTLLEQAKAAAYAKPEVEWVAYTDEDLEALRRQDAAFDAAVDEAFLVEDGEIEEARAALEADPTLLAEGPRVSPGQQITDDINADPEQVAALRRARESVAEGRRGRRLSEVLDDIEKDVTKEPPTSPGWCAPSP